MATITKENIGQLHEKISVKVSTADYLPSFEKALKEYSKKANIPGFRPGMVPKGMIKKMYGQSLFMDEVLKSVDKELIDYLQNEKVEIFAQPLPMDTDMSKLDVYNPAEYNFDFEIGLKPTVELPDLGKVKITGYNITITDEMINSEVERLQNRYGNMADKDAVDGDENIINVNFVETDVDGKDVEGGIVKDNSLLGKYFIEKVRKELTGKKAGEHIQISLGEAFEDKELEFIAQDLGLDPKEETAKQKHFRLDITKVGQLEKRELNEDFFEQLYPGAEVKTEESFKNKIHDEINKYWDAQSRNQIHDQIFHSLVDATKVDFPQAFLKRWLKVQSGQEGQPAKTDEQIEQEMPSFLNQLKWTLISDKIVIDNSINVSPEEIKDFAKQQLFNYMGGNTAGMEEQPWVTDYIEKMMKDRKYIEESYTRLQSQKIFDWAEKQVNPVAQDISVEDFSKMVSEHQHNHH